MPNRPVRQIVAGQTVLTAPSSISVAAAAAKMKTARVGALLLVDQGRTTGIFTERDALNRVLAEGLDPSKTLVSQVMTPDPRTIAADKPFGHALHMMYEGGFRHVPVEDNGKVIGIVSARDALGPEMEQFESDLRRREAIGEILG